MSRDLPTGFGAAMAGAKIHPAILVELQWPSGTVRLWNGYRDLSWNAQTWVGTGHLGSVSPIKESRDLSANGITLSLSGIPSANITLALLNNSQGRIGTVWLGELDATTGTFVIEPYQIFTGVIDVCPIDDDGTTATISVNLEKELIDKRARGRRYTHEDQQIEYAGDLGFEYVAGLADKPLNWNGPSATGAGGVVISDDSGGEG